VSPDQLRAIDDPIAREHAAREAVEAARVLMADCAAIRREAVRTIYEAKRSWREVGKSLDPPISGQSAHEVVYPRKRKATTDGGTHELHRRTSRGDRRRGERLGADPVSSSSTGTPAVTRSTTASTSTAPPPA
jgi:hypothetical protein